MADLYTDSGPSTLVVPKDKRKSPFLQLVSDLKQMADDEQPLVPAWDLKFLAASEKKQMDDRKAQAKARIQQAGTRKCRKVAALV